MKKIKIPTEEVLVVIHRPDDLEDGNHRITDRVDFPDMKLAIIVYCIETPLLYGERLWEEWVVKVLKKEEGYVFRELHHEEGSYEPNASRISPHYRFLLDKTDKGFVVRHIEWRGRVEWDYKYAISKNGAVLKRGHEKVKG